MHDFLIQLIPQFLEPARLLTILAALVVSMAMGLLIGPILGGANPLVWRLLDVLFGKLGERMDRSHRAFADLVFRGVMISALVVLTALGLGEAARWIIGVEPLFGAMPAILLSAFITSGGVWFTLFRLYRVVERHEVGQGAFYAIARSTRTNLAAGDDHGIARAALSYMPFAFDKGLVAPAFWYFIGGFPGLSAYTGVAFLTWRFGKKGFTKGFGTLPLALERILGFIPSLISALILTLAAVITPTARTHKALAAWVGGKGRAPYAQGGLPLSVVAWALNVSLGGAQQDLTGSAIKAVWAGPEGASAQIGHKHIRRVIYLSVAAHIILMALLLAAYKTAGLL